MAKPCDCGHPAAMHEADGVGHCKACACPGPEPRDEDTEAVDVEDDDDEPVL
jgi:hypothetical protein